MGVRKRKRHRVNRRLRLFKELVAIEQTRHNETVLSPIAQLAQRFAQRSASSRSKIRTHRLDGSRPWRMRVYRDIEHWVEGDPELSSRQKPRWEKARANAKFEIRRAMVHFSREGQFSISMKRIELMYGRLTQKLIQRFLKKCPLVVMICKHIPGRNSRVYKFDFSRRTVNGDMVLVEYPGKFVLDNAHRWLVIADRENWKLSIDWFDHYEMFDSLESISLEHSIAAPRSLYGDKLSAFDRSLRNLRSASMKCMIRIKNGRTYHWLSSIPKAIRKEMSIDGERFAEVDLSSSYWCCLMSQIWEHERGRCRLIRLIQSGRFYRYVARVAGVQYGSDLKRQFQIQCLFWKPHMPESVRPLWQALDRICPGLCRLIQGVRRRAATVAGNPDYAATGLSHYITEIECNVMLPSFQRIALECGNCISLHDAALVPASKANQAKAILEQIGTRIFGFQPRITAK